ncbi:2-succinyl-6-hydroxy-2, 4-cyclohexadiene-1-carboxylate synthase [Rubrobacter xylanophilus DSM 9941]|uniref:alpha/beta hydrolase n=1 Tax=Rubrobacter xylanophilus TaxID=49319 RepID=UPI001C63E13A|nr:alpha/beta hydrolase [Rubrobacter xylanophilus]QYJ16743.1 2-succinyl-6-hydroxy-2, 4-cyclohexadiene-1-carboxylate synthase [Rubrobacter xylanophilus DSM 9941]
MIGWREERVPGEVEISVWRLGSGPDPLVCLHGITAQHRAFNFLAREMSGRRSLVGMDLRGRGDSEKPPAGYGLEAHARDVVRVLDHLGLQEATVAGHSMGAFVGLETARRHPERVRALILLDGGWPRSGEPSDELDEGLGRAFSRLERTFGNLEDYLDFWFPGRNLSPEDLPPELADYYRYDLEEADGGLRPKASLAAAREDARYLASRGPTVRELEEVRRPVALVRAAEGFFPGSEPLIPDEVRDAMAGALDVRHEILAEDANHYTLLLDPRHVRRWAGLVADEGWAR